MKCDRDNKLVATTIKIVSNLGFKMSSAQIRRSTVLEKSLKNDSRGSQLGGKFKVISSIRTRKTEREEIKGALPPSNKIESYK